MLGIDVGSTTTKMVLMENGRVVWYKIEDVGVVIEEDILSKMIKEIEQKYPIDKIIATGYGRHKISFADKIVPEVIALGKGANYFFNDADGVIDIGGQDTKVLKIDKNDINKYKSDNVAKISSMCAVFAESEIISLLSKKVPKEEILMGVYESIINRVIPMINRLKIQNMVFSGGVAKNKVLVEMFEKKLNKKLLIPGEPQIVCCVGAILI
jgi:activator of 2-hydroxyglutaryl-CoA dehydratase